MTLITSFNFVITSNAVNNSPTTDLEQQKTCFEQKSCTHLKYVVLKTKNKNFAENIQKHL